MLCRFPLHPLASQLPTTPWTPLTPCPSPLAPCPSLAQGPSLQAPSRSLLSCSTGIIVRNECKRPLRLAVEALLSDERGMKVSLPAGRLNACSASVTDLTSPPGGPNRFFVLAGRLLQQRCRAAQRSRRRPGGEEDVHCMSEKTHWRLLRLLPC